MRNDSKFSFCTFGASASADVLFPVKYETVKWDKQGTLLTKLSMTLAEMILSTKIRHDNPLASLQPQNMMINKTSYRKHKINQ